MSAAIGVMLDPSAGANPCELGGIEQRHKKCFGGQKRAVILYVSGSGNSRGLPGQSRALTQNLSLFIF